MNKQLVDELNSYLDPMFCIQPRVRESIVRAIAEIERQDKHLARLGDPIAFDENLTHLKCATFAYFRELVLLMRQYAIDHREAG